MSGDDEMGRAFGRGVIAAMAMSGLRKVTTGLGLVERIPPKRVAFDGMPALVRRISPERRDVLIELAHWTVGGVGGAAYGLLPGRVRRQAWSGPVYGVGVWLGYELLLAPILGLHSQNEPSLSERAALIADHVLYGVVVANSPWPHEPR